MNHLCACVGLLKIVGNGNRIKFCARIVAFEDCARIFPRDCRTCFYLRPREFGSVAFTDSALCNEIINSALAVANKIIGHHMEIRGLGIINITHLFGVRVIREQKQIQLVVKLEEWDSKRIYDRLGMEEELAEFLGVTITKLEIPGKPGRNIPIIIETAAMNERLKKMGYNSAREFNQNILKWIESDAARSVYYGQDDII